MTLLYILMIPIALCWGSFLNVVGYRIIRGKNIAFPRSYCPQCSHTIAWYDLIPIVSWLYLRGKCRSCFFSISPLYPFIELLTAVLFTLLITYVPHLYFWSYAFFFSALIVSIRTDLEIMLISRYATIFLVPFGALFAYFQLLPISFARSIIGALFGYAILWLIAYIFKVITKKDGIGAGDFDLLAFIGAFTGLIGVWMSVTIGSILGTIIGGIYMVLNKASRDTKLPFGPFLAAGAIIYVFIQPFFHMMTEMPPMHYPGIFALVLLYLKTVQEES